MAPTKIVNMDPAHSFPCPRVALATRSYAQGITTQSNFLE